MRFEILRPTIIEKTHGEKYEVGRIPGLVLTERGTVICYYEARECFSDTGKIDLKVVRSTDEGEHFEEILTIPGNGETLNNPVMIVDGDTVHFLFCKNYKELFYSRSTDDGKSFSAPINISHVIDEEGIPCVDIAIGPGHGIVHRGRLIVPVWFEPALEDPNVHLPSKVRTLYSEDGGESWQFGEILDSGELLSPNESALAVTPEGEVLISIRSQTKPPQKNLRSLATSHDGISNWSTPKFCESLTDPRCMGSMTHDGEWVYHINCAKENIREDLTVKISKDNFITYESLYLSKYAGYSDMVKGKDCLYVFYERFHEAFHAKWNPKVKTEPDAEDGLYFVKIKIIK